jgi:hypothetical protein
MKRIAVFAVMIGLVLVAGLAYRATDGAQAEPSILSEYPWGDVNCSGETDSRDALLILQAVAGLEVMAGCHHLADVNGDGVEDSVDAALILQFEAGLIDSLTPMPVCHPSYPTVCIPSPPPDLDCEDIEEFNFEVVGEDPHDFDPDGNGIGCETIVVVP